MTPSQWIGFELKMLWRERGVLLFALFVLGAVLLALGAQSVGAHRADAEKTAVARAERQRWLSQKEKDPHSAAHYSIYAFKRSPALAALDPGIEAHVGQAVWLEAHVQNDMLHRPKGEASVLERASAMNPSGLLIVLGPLVAFLFAYFLIARERDRGTLALLLSTARYPRQLMYSKAALVWLLMSVLLILPPAIASAAGAIARGSLDGDALTRLTLWMLAMSAYFGVLVLGSMALIMRVRDARVAVVALFGVWVLLALAAPRGLESAVQALQPLPSTQAIKHQMHTEAPAYWSAEVSEARLEALLKRYKVDRKEDLPIDERGAQLDEAERSSHAVFDRVLGGFYDRVAQQDSLYARSALLSPAVAVQVLSAAFAGSDFHHHRHFIEAAEHYRRALVNRMNGELLIRPVNDGGERYLAGADLWARIRAFEYAHPRVTHAAPQLFVAGGALLCWLALIAFAFHRGCRGLQP